MLEAHSFFATLSVIIVSELGDKTFFIAAIMAMTHSRMVVFFAAISALIVMTLLSVFLGMTTAIIPKSYTHYASIALFLGFGLKMLWDAKHMSGDEAQEEYEEVKKELAEKTEEQKIPPVNGIIVQSSSLPTTPNGNYNNNADSVPLISIDNMSKDPETGLISTPNGSDFFIPSVPVTQRIKRALMKFVSLVFLETFTMTFLAEWGDRSQITTIILAAREEPFSVSTGAIIGHAICSLIAVVGGRIVSQMISARTVTLIGGAMFIGFAFSALLLGE
jgi:putative Ca2+/H+ antiporter (TMEM165/GDT1 family)